MTGKNPWTRSREVKLPKQQLVSHNKEDVEVEPSIKFPYDPVINTENGSKKSWFISIESKLNKTSYQKPSDWSIFKVPDTLRSLNPDAYTPQLVSVGPIHHKKDSPLQFTESLKLGYVQCLLNRTRNPKSTLFQCTEAVLRLEHDARSRYADNALDDDDHKSIAEILLVDGCFVVELLLKFSEYDKNKDDGNHPLFSNVWMLAALQRDLSLLENQLPFDVLQTLFRITTVDLVSDDRMWVSVANFAFHFFSSAMPLVSKVTFYRRISAAAGFRHLLDLVHKCLEPEEKITKLYDGYYKEATDKKAADKEAADKEAADEEAADPEAADPEAADKDECLMRTIGELVDSGVEIRRGDGKYLVGVKFEEGSGILTIPEICVDDMTETLLRNLVAYEQYCSPGRRHVTAYVLLMDRLISSEGDVEALEKARVLKNNLGHSGRVTDLFNGLSMGVVITEKDKFMFSEASVKVDGYCSKWLPKNMALLRREYFPNIWQIVAFAIAFLLLILTIQQSVYTILSYP